MSRRWIRVGSGAVAAAVLGAGVWVPGTASAQQGEVLVSERFTGATADSRFVGFGSACLTGAERGAAPGAGRHPLGGCSTTQQGPVPPGEGAPYGYLQLTDASNDQSGAVLFEEAIPATDGLEVTFEQWQYGTTTAEHADGISFFLSDGDRTLNAPGAFGGSLGYAQKLPDDDPSREFIPGVAGGYLGLGFDVLGNYFGDWERRGDGCAERSPAGTVFRDPAPGPNMVTLRGPGDGTTGYCWLDATTSNKTTTGPWPSTLPGQLVGPLTTLPPGTGPQQAEALLEPSKRTVRVTVTPAPSPVVTVDIDFNDGEGFQRVLTTPAPPGTPDTYHFGFAGSTGLFTDVHLIRNVVISTARPPAGLSLVKRPYRHHRGAHPGDPLRYTFTVTNTGDEPIEEISIDDSRISQVRCPARTLDPGESLTCRGVYRITPADIRKCRLTNIATATGRRQDDGTEVVSNPSKVTVPLCGCRHKHPGHKHPCKRRPEPWNRHTA